MPVELRVPQVGESITEVQISKWIRREGESARKDETVVVLETDKVTVELPAPVDGAIVRILKQDGEKAQVGEVIGYMEEASVASASAPAAARPAAALPAAVPASAAAAPPAPEPAAAGKPAGTRAGAGAKQVAAAEARVMPAARRALHEQGVSLADVQPSGPGGRVLLEDVQRAAGARTAPPAAPAAAPLATAPAPAAPAARAAYAAPAMSPGPRQEERVPMTPLRRRIAERLLQAQNSAALLTTFNEIDMSAVLELRKSRGEVFMERHGVKLGFMSFFVKAAVDALGLVPQVNAEIRGDDIVYKNYCDIGVAIGGGKGLVVPILRDAERLSFAEIEQKIADFGKRAQESRIALEELQGGTFTISNGGVYGSLLSTPILNPPQSGVLGLHAIQERPVARDAQVVIRPMMYVALTYDHRLVDGREAVTFLKRIKECVEDPARMLLEV